MKIKDYLKISMAACLPLLFGSFCNDNNRGIGKYPGAPAENFSPTLVSDTVYRNIALNRIAYHSSAYDYNLTSQLVTDGIASAVQPAYLTAFTNTGELPRREREWAIDGGEYTRNILMGSDAFIQYDWHNMSVGANKIKLICSVAYRETQADDGFSIKVLSGGKVIGKDENNGLPGKASEFKAHTDPNKSVDNDLIPTRNIETVIDLKATKPLEQLRLELKMKGAVHWTVTEIKFYKDSLPVTDVLPSASFNSSWMSAKADSQWVYVDLGSYSTFDKVRLHWIEKAMKGQIETSDDAVHWTAVATLPGGDNALDDIKVDGRGRYVRVLMQQPTASGRYVLSEMEVMGNGGLVPTKHAECGFVDGRYLLDGGNWRIQRASQVQADGEHLSQIGFNASDWLVATVPGTVLTSYVNAGALPDPNYADNLFFISESFFNSNFWYRNEFIVPQSMKGRHIFLNFDGINWKANIFLNGRRIDRMEGAFVRGRVDVTDLLKDGTNVVAVEIIKNAHPGAIKEKNSVNTDFNGGILGYDNPTFHSTIGWDWISTIRGRDIGIWNDVSLSASGAVSLHDPLVTSRLALPDTLATVTPSVILTNNEQHAVSGTLKGRIGDITFEKRVDMPAATTQEVSFDPDRFTMLRNQRLRLWWPNGYGTPYLYKASFEFIVDGRQSDSLSFMAGIRQVEYKDVKTKLTMYVNGQRFIPLGGNWGFSENNLNYRGREYDIAVGYHRDMNFNMIRDWVGQIGDEEFYEACDKYGIMVWQDFWLANPADGPDPLDENMFLANARDYMLRIRNHASIGLYCGRNEGYPPATIDKTLREYVSHMHPGLGYISSSADDGVSGHGPYWALPAKEYFERQSGKLHSERGMPNVMTYEGLSRTFRPEKMWPQGDAWGQHDYTMQGAQRGASFNNLIKNAFGEVGDARRFAELAQWENYEGYRAMYESGSRDRMGLLIWMSHPCWPSMTWQTYDYYFEPTAAYFGCRKACEPLHVQWNPLTDKVEVVNLSKGNQKKLGVSVELLDMYGHKLWKDTQKVDCANDATVPCMSITRPEGLKGVYYLRLNLTSKGKPVSTNFYVCTTDSGNFRQLNTLPRVAVAKTVSVAETVDGYEATVDLTAPKTAPAMMVRLNLKASDGEQILPVIYSDNYFHLMPGEKRKVTVKWKTADARGCTPVVDVSCFNGED